MTVTDNSIKQSNLATPEPLTFSLAVESGVNYQGKKMGIAYFIVTKPEIPGIDTVIEVDGKCLARISSVFEDRNIYESESIVPLEEFIGGAGLDYDEGDLGELADTCYDPDTGLKTVSSMKEYILKNEKHFEDVDSALGDLENFSKILEICIDKQMKRCLGIDV